MSRKHLVFIINPKSGMERQKEIQHGIDDCLDQQQYSYGILHTEFAKHGTELAAEAARNGAYAVVAVGGDGSVNDIVQGLLGTRTLLAIIPKGSGNGMARTMGIPLNTHEAMKLINTGKIAAMDVGYANGKPFISNAGVAFDALISKKFARSERRGFMMYSWLVAKYMWLYKNWDWTITVDGKETKARAFMVNVANGQQFGYNFKIAPMASYTDGVLDVIIIRKFPKILGGAIVVRALNGSITGSPFVQHLTGKVITISNPALKLMQTDGDAHACESSITFKIAQGAQGVIVP
jgi:diacylglycerol kinase (ATP)